MAYIPIPQNPYIVGNPIQSEKMFYGRNEDFLYIKDKLQKETKGLILTLAGERRSGKTSILFQIMNGRLGPDYLPFFIDLQALAAVESDNQFLARIDQNIRSHVDKELPALSYEHNCWQDFESLLSSIKTAYPNKMLVFLFDEYELIENKIEKGLISEELITFFANLMENQNVYFIFTGSNKLEDRRTLYWKTLFSKSQYRKITFLKHNDCLDLITKPLEGYINYTDEQKEKVWRLTAGQPFYTQIFCQNMVDRLQVEKRNDVWEEDIDAVIADIVNNPMPQMIYFWQELEPHQKLALSVLAEVLTMKEDWADSQKLVNTLKAQKLDLPVTAKDFHSAMEELYHKDILSKRDNDYQFRVDIFRFWVKQEQNIWKLMREIKLEKPASQRKKYKLVLKVIGVLLGVTAIVLNFWGNPPVEFGTSKNKEARGLYRQANSYFEDSNYTQALSTVDNALKADSTFFKACLLRAEILKAMNNPDQALKAYEKAERIYYKLSQNIGKLLGTLPDSLANDNHRNWRKQNDFVILDNFTASFLYVQMGFAPENITMPVVAYDIKAKKWFYAPAASIVGTRKHTIYYYDAQKNSVIAHNVKSGKTLWKHPLPATGQKHQVYLAAFQTGKWKSNYLTIFNRNGFFVINSKNGKEVVKRLYKNDDLKSVFQDDNYRKLLVYTDNDRYIYRFPGLKQLYHSAFPEGKTSLVAGDGFTFYGEINAQTGNRQILNFDAKKDSLVKIINTEEISEMAVSLKLFWYIKSDTLFQFQYTNNKLKKVALPGNPKMKSLLSAFLGWDYKAFAIACSDSELYILNEKGKLLNWVPLAQLSEDKKVRKILIAGFDPGRKRLIYVMPQEENGTSENSTIGIYDIRHKKIIFSNNLNKAYTIIMCNRNLYCLKYLANEFDGKNVKLAHNLLFIDPKTFQLMPYEKTQYHEFTNSANLAIKNNRIFELSTYPASDERALQKVQENLILLYDSLNQNDKVLATFDKMLSYIRNLNNLPVTQSVIRNVVSYRADDLGYYASRLLALDANFKKVQPVLETAMNVRPNAQTPPLTLKEREFLGHYKDDLYTRQYDAGYNYIDYYLLNNGKREFLFKTNRDVGYLYYSGNIFPYIKPGEKPLIHFWKSGREKYTCPLPFAAKQRAAIDWLNDKTAFFITQKQNKQDFSYELGTLDLITGKATIHQRWNNSLHLKITLVKDNRLGLAMTDSVKAVYYVPTQNAPSLLPPLAQIIKCNGQPVTLAAQLDPRAAPSFAVEYLYKGQTGSITLNQQQMSSAMFSDMVSSQLIWYDFKTDTFTAPIAFVKFLGISSQIKCSDISSHLWGDYINGNLEVDNGKIFQITNINTGALTYCMGYPDVPHINTEYDWYNHIGFVVWSGERNANQISLTFSKFNPGGILKPVWTTSIPWNSAALLSKTPTHLITYAKRKIATGEDIYAVLYLNINTGSIDRRISLLKESYESYVLWFDTKPLLLYDPALGFLNPIPPQ